jgi:ribosomal protein S18 acetylase RimI-like enzyme
VTPTIRPATEAELAAVGAHIALSFDDLEQNHSLVPDPAARLRVMGDFFTLLTEHAPRCGKVDVIDDPELGLAAAAVWFDRTVPMPEVPDYEHRLAALAGEWLPHFEALDEVFDKHHPVEPHWHLAFLAVHPRRQGRGLGGALMAGTHEEIPGVPVYLEATNDDNIRLYHRYGYTNMTPFDIRLPDATPFYRMWRPAHV